MISDRRTARSEQVLLIVQAVWRVAVTELGKQDQNQPDRIDRATEICVEDAPVDALFLPPPDG
jgi:hypothetical protein